MKKLLVFLFIGLFLISFASAATFDNRIRSYDDKTETIIIDDNFGFGGDLVKVQLIDNTYFCGTECSAIWNVTIYNDEDNFLTDLEFEIVNGHGGISSHKFEVVTGYDTIIVNDYVKDCRGVEEGESCPMVVSGSHEEQVPIWTTFNPERKLPVGNYIIKLTGKKNWEDSLDWVPTYYGKEIRQWAFWASTSPTSYYNFNEVNGSTQALDFIGLNPLTVNTTIAGFGPGKLANGYSPTTLPAGGVGLNSSTGVSEFVLDENDFTFSYWINGTSNSGSSGIMDHDPSSATGWGINRLTNGLKNGFQNNGAVILNTTELNDGNWHNVVWVREGLGSNEFKVYVDNINQQNATFNVNISDSAAPLNIGISNVLVVQLDDLQIYNGFAWSVSDVNFSYNNGAGREANITIPGTIDITLNSPADNTFSTVADITFNATGLPTSINITNATLILSDKGTGATVTEDFITIDHTLTNDSIFNLTSIALNTYSWNVLFCGTQNSGVTNCSVAASNFTLDIGIQEINSFFINETTEGDTTTFQINISIPDGRQISTNNLHYNNTINTGTRTVIAGNNWSIITTQSAPLVSTQTNISFFWNITLDDGFEFNSATSNQSVININADDCSTNTVLILNYTLKDEGTQVTAVPDGGLVNSTMQIDLTINSIGTSDAIISFSQNYTNTNPAQVCLNQINDSAYDMNALIRYEFTDHVVEFNNIQKFRLQNSSIPQNINLLDLLTVDSQEFLITFKDKNTLPVAGALIDISRKYISEGVFKTIEAPVTDVNAQVLAHLVLSDEIYTFTVKKDGVILGVFENLVAFCDNLATGDCTINLNAFSPGFNSDNFIASGNLNLQTTYNVDTRVITTLFTTIDGSVATVQLNGTLNDAFGNTTICSDSLTSSTGTLICSVPNSFGNSSVISQVFNGGTLVGQNIFSTALDPAEIFGGTRVVLTIILFSTVSLMALSSGPATLILSTASLIIAGLLNLYIEGSIIGAGSMVLWFGIAIAVILFKMSRRNAD